MILVLFCTWEDTGFWSLKLALRHASVYLGPVTQSPESRLFFSILDSPQGLTLVEVKRCPGQGMQGGVQNFQPLSP